MSITFTQSPRLKIHCTSLIINYKKVFGTIEVLNEFQKKTKCNIVSNYELIVTHDMMAPSESFKSIIENYLVPRGFIWGKDFTVAEEQMIYGVSDRITPLLNHGLPELKNVNWLDSIVTMDGCFVWSRNSEIIKSKT
jgi:hypothetical protein